MIFLLSFLSLFSYSYSIDTKIADAYKYNTSFPLINSEEIESVGRYGWVSYKQCDSAWANQQLGYCSLTICSAGCAMRLFYLFLLIIFLIFVYFCSSVAMILSTKGAWQNPGQLDSWLTQNGGYANGCDIYW